MHSRTSLIYNISKAHVLRKGTTSIAEGRAGWATPQCGDHARWYVSTSAQHIVKEFSTRHNAPGLLAMHILANPSVSAGGPDQASADTNQLQTMAHSNF